MLKLIGFKFGEQIDNLTWKYRAKKKKDWPWPNCRSTYGLGIHLPISIHNIKVSTRPCANPNFNLPSVSPQFSLTPNLWPILKKFMVLILPVFYLFFIFVYNPSINLKNNLKIIIITKHSSIILIKFFCLCVCVVGGGVFV